MKAKTVNVVKPFSPVKLEITLESLEEIEMIHNIFNCSQILSAAYIQGEPVREAICDAMEDENFRTRNWLSFITKLRKLCG